LPYTTLFRSQEVGRSSRTSSWMLARLAHETQAQHDVIDDLILTPLVAPTRARYRHYLARMYGFEAPLGCALVVTAGLDPAFVVPRVRAGWLAHDLMALGLSPTEAAVLQQRHEVPAFGSGAEALGWLYVLERTMLRHDLLRRRLARALPQEIADAGAYLGCYRTRARNAWAELGSLLDRTACSVAAVATIISAARAGLASQQGWLARTQLPAL